MDGSLYRLANRLADRTPWAHGVLAGYANGGVVLFAAILLVALWRARTTSEPTTLAAAVWAGVGVLAALGVAQVIGNLVDRARPYDAIAGAHVLVARTQDFSFPSDHATVAGAVAAGVWLVDRRLGVVATVAALVMAATRVYVGAHYPGDVLAGLVLGAVVVRLGWPLVRPVLTAGVAVLVGTRLGPVLAKQPQRSDGRPG